MTEKGWNVLLEAAKENHTLTTCSIAYHKDHSATINNVCEIERKSKIKRGEKEKEGEERENRGRGARGGD